MTNDVQAKTGLLARVGFVYPLAVPAMVMLAALFPGYFRFDAETYRVTISVTLPELAAAFTAGYAVVAAVFAKWGRK